MLGRPGDIIAIFSQCRIDKMTTSVTTSMQICKNIQMTETIVTQVHCGTHTHAPAKRNVLSKKLRATICFYETYKIGLLSAIFEMVRLGRPISLLMKHFSKME